MGLLPRDRLERLALLGLAAFIVTMLGFLTPSVLNRLQPPPPAATAPPATPPPAAVLLPEELQRDLEGVVILVNDKTFGTAFQVDSEGDLITAAHLISGNQSLRIVDNTGGSHPVEVVGVDAQLDIAQVRAKTDGLPLTLGDSGAVHANDPVALLASPKNGSLPSSTPGVITGLRAGVFAVQAGILPGNAGGPVVGIGGNVLGVVLGSDPQGPLGSALPIELAKPDLTAWHSRTGTVFPLAPLPPNLILRGAGETTTASPGSTVPRVDSAQPSRASAAAAAVLTLRGSGFVAGRSLRVHFAPVSSQSGGFDGVAVALADATTITVKVPAGHVVQDYVIQVTNGDGSVLSSRATFTITP